MTDTGPSWLDRLRRRPRPVPPPGEPPQAQEPAAQHQDTEDTEVYAEGLSPVDVCFVFDTTGSMSGKIVRLTDCMVEFVDALAGLRLDWRVTTVPFGDLTVPGDRVVGDAPFVGTRKAAEAMLRGMPRFSGGSNRGESSLEAMLAALRKPYRRRAVTVLVVLTDEPPVVSADLTEDVVAEQLTAREVICFVASPDRPGYRRWAEDNGGRWYPIAASMDTSDLLAYLRSLVRDLPQVAREVHELGGGSVRRYLERKRGGEAPDGDERGAVDSEE